MPLHNRVNRPVRGRHCDGPPRHLTSLSPDPHRYLIIAIGIYLTIVAAASCIRITKHPLLSALIAQSRTLSTTSNASHCNVQTLPAADRCAFVDGHGNECGADIGLLNYMHLAYCSFGTRPTLALLLLGVWTAFLFALMLVCAEHFFCPALEELAQFLQLPDHLAGATLMAFGNGANDCFVMAAAIATSGDTDGVSAALSEAFSGGFFVTNVVAGLAVIFAPMHPVMVGKDYSRDVGFYLGAVVLVFAAVADGRLFLWEGITFFLYYLLYLAVTLYSSRDQEPLEAPVGDPRIHHEIAPKRTHHTSDRVLPSLEEGTVYDDPSVPPSRLNSNDSSPRCQAPEPSHHQSLSEAVQGLAGREPVALGLVSRDSGSLGSSPLGNSHRMAGGYREEGGRVAGAGGDLRAPLLPVPPRHNYSRQTSTLSQVVVEQLDELQRLKAIAEWPLVLLLRLFMPQVDPNTVYPRPFAVMLPLTAPLLWVAWGGYWTQLLSVMGLHALLLSLMGCTCVWCVYPAHGRSFGRLAGVFVVMAFLQSMLLLSLLSSEVMAASVAIGSLAGMSQSLLAATLLAWGNSVQDMVANLTMSATGYPLVAITACLAAPLFNVLVGMGLGIVLRTLRHGSMMHIRLPNSLLVLFVAHSLLLVRYLVEVPCFTRNKFTRASGAVSLGAWLLLMPIFVLTSLGILFPNPWM